MSFIPLFDFRASPTLWTMINDRSFVRAVIGPFGSGKSTAMCGEVMRIACSMPVAPDGIMYSRHAIVRNTSVELKSTTIKTWLDHFPEEKCGPIRYSSPIRWHFHKDPKYGGPEGKTLIAPGVDIEVLFVPLDKPKDVKKLLSMELTSAWINEGSEVPKAIVDALTGRVGRYPGPGKLPAGATCPAFILIDSNPPDDDSNWLNQGLLHGVEATIPGTQWKFWQQPPAVIEVKLSGGRYVSIELTHPGEFDEADVMPAAGTFWAVNPNAENLPNLRGNGLLYYAQQIGNKSRSWIQRFLQARCVYVQDGKPVIPEFNGHIMVRELRLLEGKKLFAGLDIGGGTLQPAAIFGQRHDRGNWLIHRELVATDMGLENFSSLMMQFIAAEFRGVAPGDIDLFCDPAAAKRDDLYEIAILDHLRAKGFNAREAPTNDPEFRREAIALPMTRLIDGLPGFLIDPRCKMLIAGLSGKWKFRRLQVTGREAYAETAEKNAWSHPCDGLGYLLSGGGETRKVQGRKQIDQHARVSPGRPGSGTVIVDQNFKVL